MPLISVTRFRARSICFVPLFAIHARRTIAQIRKADGFIGGAVRRDKDLAFWTMTVWRDERAMRAYAASGAHGKAMPHLRDWGMEASVVRWFQNGADLPDWSAAVRRMREEGQASKLRRPGPNHTDLGFAEPQTTYETRL